MINHVLCHALCLSHAANQEVVLELISFFQRALPEAVLSGGGKRREEEEHPDREDQQLSTEQVSVSIASCVG